MGRKNEIEGQINLFDMLVFPKETLEEDNEKVGKDTVQRTQEASQKVIQKSEKTAPGTFIECTSCWCSTCEHSTIGGSVPRPFAGTERPCPSCELCVREGVADICVIGSADEGCRYRAQKEGLIPE